ncbi:unnamed protein product [marine sediment metagenome]|uniref:Uncharacterized protein n=1 Tax=marine sediment metagenome TaxID=412755 RepID=X1GW39_9ZZZZ
MVKILRLTQTTMAQPDGTRVPKTTVNWIDDDGVSHVSLLDGHVSSAEAQYLVGAV